MSEGLIRAFAETHGVKIGQLWRDNDPRHPAVRTLRIDRFWVVRNGIVRAECTVLETGRIVNIAVKRFKPTSNGYRQVPMDESAGIL